MRVRGNESCLLGHDTSSNLHYMHNSQHSLPFALHFQTAAQAHLLGKIASHRLLVPLCLFQPGKVGDQGILVLC